MHPISYAVYIYIYTDHIYDYIPDECIETHDAGIVLSAHAVQTDVKMHLLANIDVSYCTIGYIINLG